MFFFSLLPKKTIVLGAYSSIRDAEFQKLLTIIVRVNVNIDLGWRNGRKAREWINYNKRMGDDGSEEMDIAKLRIGAVEHTYLALVWDAFGITDDPDLPEVSPQGERINNAYTQGQNESTAKNSFFGAEA